MSKVRVALESPVEKHDDELIQYRILFAVTFALLFLIAVFSSAVGLKWRTWFLGTELDGSLIGGVRAAVGSVLPVTFV